MNTEEFSDKVKYMLPIKRKQDDFRDDLKIIFDNYLKLINSLDGNIKSQYQNWDNIIVRIESLIKV